MTAAKFLPSPYRHRDSKVTAVGFLPSPFFILITKIYLNRDSNDSNDGFLRTHSKNDTSNEHEKNQSTLLPPW